MLSILPLNKCLLSSAVIRPFIGKFGHQKSKPKMGTTIIPSSYFTFSFVSHLAIVSLPPLLALAHSFLSFRNLLAFLIQTHLLIICSFLIPRLMFSDVCPFFFPPPCAKPLWSITRCRFSSSLTRRLISIISRALISFSHFLTASPCRSPTSSSSNSTPDFLCSPPPSPLLSLQRPPWLSSVPWRRHIPPRQFFISPCLSSPCPSTQYVTPLREDKGPRREDDVCVRMHGRAVLYMSHLSKNGIPACTWKKVISKVKEWAWGMAVQYQC